MPRQPRKISSTGFYHICNRGINGRNIFLTAKDHDFFVECLKRALELCGIKILACTVMTNHFHIVIRVNEGEIPPPSLFKSIGARYAAYYRREHGVSGQIFQGRYYSEIIKDDAQLVSALCYVWNNPVEAGICKSPADHRWGSFRLLGKKSDYLDNEFILKIMSFREWRRCTADAHAAKHPMPPEQYRHSVRPARHIEPIARRKNDAEATKIVQNLRERLHFEGFARSTEDETVVFVGECICHDIPIAQLARIGNESAGRLYRFAHMHDLIKPKGCAALGKASAL